MPYPSQSRLSRRLRVAALAASLALPPALAASPAPCPPGDGTIANGKLDITVYFAYAEADLGSWQPVFQEFSKLLYDATEKQLQLGTVTFTRCVELKERADVWILGDLSGAQAHLQGLGVLGRHITISQAHKAIAGNSVGQFGLMHEAGHYLWGLRDEYQGVVGQALQEDPLHFCVSANGTIASIMDGGSAVTPNNQRTEFCTASFPATKHWRGANNGAGLPVKNMQEHQHGESCWETMVRSRVGSLRAPTDEPRNDIGGHQPVTFARIDGELALMMVLDRSGSMNGAPITLAKQGAEIGVGLMRDGQRLGVVSFADDARLDLDIAELTSVHRGAASPAIDGLVAGGSTAIGEGLLLAQAQLDTVAGCSEVVVLLSDGVSNTGPTPDSVLPTLLQQGTRVYCIGLGNTNVAVLTRLATRTGGRFFLARAARDLPAIFQQILADAQGGVLGLNALAQSINASEQQTRGFTVAGFTDRLLVSVGFAAGSPLTLSVRTPDNRVIDRTNYTAFPGARFLESSVQQLLDLPAPRSGAWSAIVTAGSGAGASTYDLATINVASTLSIVPYFGSGQVSYPQPIPLAVQVVAGWPVAGANVKAQVTGPAGAALGEVPLFDDGLPVHGDAAAGDGVYSTLFAGYRGNGIYTFAIEVDNVNGRSATYNECPPSATFEQGNQSRAIAPFRATAIGSTSVTGVPANVVPAQVTLAAAGRIDGQDLTLAAASLAPLLDLSLTFGATENVVVEALAVRADGEVDPALLGELSVYVDGNEDGRVDLPARPIATGRFGSATAAIFTALDNQPLLLGAAGGSVRLLLTVGAERILGAAAPPAVPLSGPPAAPPLGGRARWPWGGVLLALAAAALAAAGTYLRRRPVPALGSEPPRPRLAWSRWSAASAAALAFAVVLTTACGSRGKPTQVRGATGLLTLTVNPVDVAAKGATTGQSLAITGARVRTNTTIR